MQLGERQGDGASLRTHLQRAAYSTGKVHPLLEPTQLPTAARAVWDAFLDLSAVRRTAMGLHPLTMTDIEAWCRLNRVRLTPWELSTLIALDSATLNFAAKQQQSKH